MNTNLLQGIVSALTTPEWKVDVEKAGTPDEEWMVCTVDVDADDDGRPVDRGHSVLECVAPVGDPQEGAQVRRSLELLPSLLYMVAELGSAMPESQAGKRARAALDYIRTGRWADLACEEGQSADASGVSEEEGAAQLLRRLAQNDYMINSSYLPDGQRLLALADALETAERNRQG